MKICNGCGSQNNDEVKFCINCGSSDFKETVSPEAGLNTAVGENAVVSEPIKQGGGNIVAGIVGAFLFSLIGGLLYFLVYQMGFIASICGLVIFVLANFGYGLFSKVKDSTVGIVISVMVTLVMIFIAEYFSLSYEIYDFFRDEFEITFMDAVRATPDILSEPEIMTEVVKDLVFAYALSAVAVASNIVAKKKAQKQSEQVK